jgi:hypothetical protein
MVEVPSIRDQIPGQTQENFDEIDLILFDTPATLQAYTSRLSPLRRWKYTNAMLRKSNRKNNLWIELGSSKFTTLTRFHTFRSDVVGRPIEFFHQSHCDGHPSVLDRFRQNITF